MLHSRAYRSTSLIVELFTWRYGRVSVLARSARGLKSRFQGQLQMFMPILISYSGRGELKNVSQLELNGKPYHLGGRYLMCGFYLNELLVRLLQKEDPHPKVFTLYQDTLNAMEQQQHLEHCLRVFEKRLLQLLGYGLSLQFDAINQQPVVAGQYYRYIPEQGLVQIEKLHASKSDIDSSLERLNKLNESSEGFDPAEVKKELQECMQNYFGVFRRGEYMKKGLDKLNELREKVDNLHLKDKSDAFNTNRVEAIELQNLFEVAESTAISAYRRTESRGAHARDDYPDRDDDNWLCHSIYDPISKEVSKREVNFEPQKVEAFPPKIRTY